MSTSCHPVGTSEQFGVDRSQCDFLVALAGNPNVGKSTVFNALSGLKQHTGNWPGKTVTRAEGFFTCAAGRGKVVDLPGTYSLLSASVDEEVARDFILFGRPDCTVIVVDATALERNLNLVLQVLEVTDRAVVCLNLMDEARRKGISVDHRALADLLGVPVVPAAARRGEGLSELVETVAAVASGRIRTSPFRLEVGTGLGDAVRQLAAALEAAYPGLASSRWVAMRLLDGDWRVREALETGGLGQLALAGGSAVPQTAILDLAASLQRNLGGAFRDQIVYLLFAEAERIARQVVRQQKPGRDLDRRIDAVVTSRFWGLPLMGLLLGLVFWLTIAGANLPSQLLATALFWLEDQGAALFAAAGLPDWIIGFLWHGVYRGLAWVVAVMLPPMAIFFPAFTLLEDLGYLPRVAFNVDRLLMAVGAHGKQALTMSMGLGCNAAGVIACRIIESPRERLIAILTNNFMPCNGRWPTLIMLATVFVGTMVPPAWSSVAAAGSLVMVVLLGAAVTLAMSALLSRTMLKGEASSFTLELPPYRKPDLMRVLYTSMIDRTLFVLWRAVMMAAPAGGVIWLMANVYVYGNSMAAWVSGWLNPLGQLIGLDGVVLLAFVIALPANEIVVPTILMAYTGAGVMLEADSFAAVRTILVDQQGWTLLTGVSLMLFSLLHNPCSTTIMTIYQETKSARWAAVGTFLPLAVAVGLLMVLNLTVRLVG